MLGPEIDEIDYDKLRESGDSELLASEFGDRLGYALWHYQAVLDSITEGATTERRVALVAYTENVLAEAISEARESGDPYERHLADKAIIHLITLNSGR